MRDMSIVFLLLQCGVWAGHQTNQFTGLTAVFVLGYHEMFHFKLQWLKQTDHGLNSAKGCDLYQCMMMLLVSYNLPVIGE
jgi:hypothetical protein